MLRVCPEQQPAGPCKRNPMCIHAGAHSEGYSCQDHNCGKCGYLPEAVPGNRHAHIVGPGTPLEVAGSTRLVSSYAMDEYLKNKRDHETVALCDYSQFPGYSMGCGCIHVNPATLRRLNMDSEIYLDNS